LEKVLSAHFRDVAVSGKGGPILEGAEALPEGTKTGLKAPLPTAEKLKGATAEDVLRGRDPTVYVEDSPGMHHRDWGPSVWRDTLKAAVEAQEVEILRVVDGGTGKFKPAIAYEPGQRGRSFQRVTQRGMEAQSAGTVLSAALAGIALGAASSGSDECEDEARKNIPCVYVVRAKSGQPLPGDASSPSKNGNVAPKGSLPMKK
jgi:hypothetical protein